MVYHKNYSYFNPDKNNPGFIEKNLARLDFLPVLSNKTKKPNGFF